jgi:hypothetical protein
MVVRMLASRRDAPAGLIQWGDDPSSTRYGLRSFQGFEAHKLFWWCLRFRSFDPSQSAVLCVSLNKNRFFVLTTKSARDRTGKVLGTYSAPMLAAYNLAHNVAPSVDAGLRCNCRHAR